MSGCVSRWLLLCFPHLLQKYGYANSQCILYDECRHELLNETDKEKVYNDIYEWITNP